MSNKMHTSARIRLCNLLSQDGCSCRDRRCGGNAGDENVSAGCSEDVGYAAPVRDGERCKGGTKCEGIEAEKAVAEYYGIVGRKV